MEACSSRWAFGSCAQADQALGPGPGGARSPSLLDSAVAVVTPAEVEAKESLAAEPPIQVATQRPAWCGLGCVQLGDRNQRLPQDSKTGK